MADRVAGRPTYVDVDPFELPDWLGSTEVTWSATCGLGAGHRVTGLLSAPGHDAVACDLVAVDLAHPAPVADDGVRVRAHQQWQHGQVLLLGDDRAPVVLAVPGSSHTAGSVVVTVARLALAVGAPPSSYAVHLRLGDR